MFLKKLAYAVTAARGYTFKTEYGVSPSEYSKNSYDAIFFSVDGVTDKRFDSEAKAAQAIKKRFPKWVEIKSKQASCRIFKHPSKEKYLTTYQVSTVASKPTSVTSDLQQSF